MLKLIQTSEGFNTHLLLVMYLRQYALLDSYRLRWHIQQQQQQQQLSQYTHFYKIITRNKIDQHADI